MAKPLSLQAGISVAHNEGVMRWSEAVTIYLAVGASFGVSRYLRAASGIKSRSRASAEGMAVALLWPLMAAAILAARLRHSDEVVAADDTNARLRAKVEEAGRALLLSVNELMETGRAVKMETMEHTLYALRDGAEQYLELADMQAWINEDGSPAAHEMELARLSGRRGRDLQLAGICAHRRNVSRLHTRHARERARLLRKLSELRDDEGKSCPSQQDEASDARLLRMSEARLRVYARAARLFSLVEDEAAARSAAQLMDAEYATLRRLKVWEEENAHATFPGEEQCTEHTHKLIYKDPLRTTTLTQG
jgi:hypothetical protein